MSNGSTADDLQQVITTLTSTGRRAVVLPGDLAHEDYIANAVAQAIETFGRIDILVNAAGIDAPGAVVQLATSEWGSTSWNDIATSRSGCCAVCLVLAVIGILSHSLTRAFGREWRPVVREKQITHAEAVLEPPRDLLPKLGPVYSEGPVLASYRWKASGELNTEETTITHFFCSGCGGQIRSTPGRLHECEERPDKDEQGAKGEAAHRLSWDRWARHRMSLETTCLAHTLNLSDQHCSAHGKDSCQDKEQRVTVKRIHHESGDGRPHDLREGVGDIDHSQVFPTRIGGGQDLSNQRDIDPQVGSET